jgi:hypothetical protein
MSRWPSFRTSSTHVRENASTMPHRMTSSPHHPRLRWPLESAVPKEKWRNGRDSVRWCVFLRIHGHWCVTGFCRCRTVTHADTAVFMESSWNPGNLSQTRGGFEPCGRQPVIRISPASGLAWRVRFSSIHHTSARSVPPIKVVFGRRGISPQASSLPFFPPSGPARLLFQEPPAKANSCSSQLISMSVGFFEILEFS